MASLTIIILTCNQTESTRRCLSSLTPYMLEHHDTNVLLIDNGSEDNQAASLVRRFSWPFDVIRLEKNIGVAAGRNIGLSKARGEYIMFLDNDTVIDPEAIDGLKKYLQDNPMCGIAAPALISPEGDMQDSAKDFPGIGVKLRNIFGGKSKRSSMKHPCYVIGACQMFRRSLIEVIGKLDEKIFYGPEDADFCIRAANAGFTIDYLTQFGIVHDWRRATSRHIFSPLARKHIFGLLYFYFKHRRFF